MHYIAVQCNACFWCARSSTLTLYKLYFIQILLYLTIYKLLFYLNFIIFKFYINYIIFKLYIIFILSKLCQGTLVILYLTFILFKLYINITLSKLLKHKNALSGIMFLRILEHEVLHGICFTRKKLLITNYILIHC